jgi:glycosyltransferase 2 family protein
MRWTKLLVSFGFSLIFLYLTFYVPHFSGVMNGGTGLGDALFGSPRFDMSHLGRVIAEARMAPIAFAGVLFFASLLLRAWRWRIILAPLVKMSFHDVFAAMTIGYMANNVLPFRMGEVYKAHVIYQVSGLSRSAAFGSVVLERVIDLVFMMPYMALGIVLFPLPGMMQKGAYAAAGLTAVLLAFLIWMVVDSRRALGLADSLLRVFPRKLREACLRLLEKFTSGLSVLRKSEHFVAIVLSSLGLWAMYAGMAWAVLNSLGFMNSGITEIENNVLGAVLITLIITTIGFVIPGAPGAVGTYHGMAVLGLSLFNVPGDRAAGFAIVLHALNYIPLTILGLIFFWKLGLTFRETRSLTAENETQPVPDNGAVVSTSRGTAYTDDRD